MIAVRSDRGSGSALVVALVAAVVVLTAAVLPLGRVLAARAQAAGAADAAALAAADAASGRHPGFPCELAAAVASANGVELDSCEVDGLIVTVATSGGILGFTVAARATAGPPDSP
ncbi:secretion/DNA translocation related TadE-like protein [Microbacteriaceae bacterium SG_E_30_P1]|uniref:Secretion/DNA translocation related TadE-like protein n=1 Tax=Antiquaquibacter oligotrophicus TaxID=2880260 RepID=A0ABT6KPP9_9MICO|nr:Rv3654c family TadE-like protein [Antiquaquibacter oligotrophicus]MDH6181834.1 secretion/DNA translocation related TadE-like protein [Antiquaquibacter oligotrophicus]UDF12489.1 hypothetical protein LH407_10020 [Antiquaquibacter oligotrophicus]